MFNSTLHCQRCAPFHGSSRLFRPIFQLLPDHLHMPLNPIILVGSCTDEPKLPSYRRQQASSP